MRALILERERRVRLVECPSPVPADGEVRVRVRNVGLCGSDLQAMMGSMPGLPLPLVMGHEFGGLLDDDSHVVVNPMLGCGRCAACEHGNSHRCPDRRVLGFRVSGAFAEAVVVPRRNVIPSPGLDALRAALVEPVATGLHAWRRAGCPMGSVAIVGAGSLGMCLLHVLRSCGVASVSVSDPVAARREYAEKAGAARSMAQLQGTFETVFDTAGTEGTRRDAVDCTVMGGTVALLGLHDDRLHLSAAAMIVGDRSVVGCFAYNETEFRDAVALTARMEAPWAHVVEFDDAETALAAHFAGHSPPDRIKTIFRISQ
jgi:threonine dehydrogenase-like Zn-dependent dehydrogenase